MVSDKKSTPSKLKQRQDVADCDLILDTEIDKLLDEKAAKSNLTVFNVKSILRQLIKNQMVQQVLDLKAKRNETEDREGKGSGGRENGCTVASSAEMDEEAAFCYEPKLTRAKTKELIQNNDQSQLPLWPISPAKLLQVKQSPPSETQILITAQDLPEESEAEDDEYIPKEADYHAMMSDDETSMTSLSDIGSPIPSISRHIASRRKRELIFGSPSRLISTDDDSVFKTPSPKKQIHHFPCDNAIGLRTRSKLPLNDTPLEDLEKQLIPPDITTDMYEWNDSDNEDYLHFLKTFAFSAVPDGGNDDEEADPEYNAMEDEDDEIAHDKEEHRVDRAVKVSKKELNELIAELFDGYQLPNNEGVDDLLYSVSQHNLSPEPKGGTVAASSLGGVISNVVSGEPPSSTTSKSDHLECSSNISTTQLTQDNTVNSIVTSGSQDAALPLPVKLSDAPVTPLTLVPITLSNPLQLQRVSKRPISIVPASYPPSQAQSPPAAAELFTWEMQGVLRHQIQKHIQLLTTTYVICSGVEDPQVLKASYSAKSLLAEISTSAVSNGPNSMYTAKNLKPAIEIIRIWPPRVNLSYNSPIKKKILEDYNRSSCRNIPNYEKRLVKLICESPAFMYPTLLPPYLTAAVSSFPSTPSSLPPSTGNCSTFMPSEDNLIVRGMDELKDRRLSIKDMAKIICQCSLPTRTPLQVANRIKNSKKKKVELVHIKPSSLKEYFDNNIVPVCPSDVYFPVEALAPIHQPPDLLGRKWAKCVEIIQKDTVLAKQCPTLIILNDGDLRNRRKKEKLGSVEATEEKSTGIPTCTSQFQVFTVTDDSGEPQFYYSIPTLSLYTNEGELKKTVDSPAPSDGGEPREDKESGNTASGSLESSHQDQLPQSTNCQSSTETTLQHHSGTGQGDEDEDEEDKERRKFHYDPTIDDHTEEHTETTDEESVSDQTKINAEKTSLSSPDQKGIEAPEKTPNSRKRKKIPSGSASISTPSQARSAGAGGGSKRHKYNTTPVEQLLESCEQDDGDIVDAFSEAFLQSVRQKLEGKNAALYSAFLQLLVNDCAGGDFSDGELYARVEELFKDYPDLVKEFGGLQTAEAAFATGNFTQYRESHAQIHFLHLLEKWTVNCPQLKTKIIQKLKALQDTDLTEAKIVDVMQPLFSQIQNPLILDSFKALFPSVFRPQTILSDTDYEEMDLDGCGDELSKNEAHGHSTAELELDDNYETVKLPEEKQVIASNSCPCSCHEDSKNVHSALNTRARHCNKCCLKFQDGKLFLHSGRVLKPVGIAYDSPEVAKQVFAPPTYLPPVKTTRPSSSPSASATTASMKKSNT